MEPQFNFQAAITPAAIEEARGWIGRPVRIEQYNHEAGYDAIRHYAFGIGDDNPLWCDEDYAARGPHGGMVAPPTFIFSVFVAALSMGFPGLQPFYGGCAIDFVRPIRRGERVVASGHLTDVEEVRGGAASDHKIVQQGDVFYKTPAGATLAVCHTRSYRVPHRGQPGALNYQPLEQRRYSQEELARIQADVFAEQVRGATPRHWEDVAVGDRLTPVVKGPLDRITMTCYYAGAIGTAGYKACELKWKQWHNARHHPELIPTNTDRWYFEEALSPSLGHQDDGVARTIGMPAAYDNGHQRCGWMAHLVTNWMGDHATLRRLEVRIQRPNIFGNTTWCHGEVVRKFEDGGQGAVELALRAVNQDGEQNTRGSAIVWLPRRSAA